MSLNPIVFVNRIDFVNRPIEDWPMELARLRGKPDLIPPNQLEIDWHSFRMKSNSIFTKKKGRNSLQRLVENFPARWR